MPLRSSLINLSFEIYPTDPIDWLAMHDLLTRLTVLKPKYVSIAYSNHARSFFATSLVLANFMQAYNLPTMLHLPATCFTRQDIDRIMAHCAQLKINDFLIISGDQNNHPTHFTDSLALFKYMQTNYPTAHTYGACHPQQTVAANTRHLNTLLDKKKHGAHAFLSQVFFENAPALNLAQQMKNQQLALTAGLMPITTPEQIEIVTNKLQIALPESLKNALLIHQNDAACCQTISNDFIDQQITTLMQAGITNFHIFTMNQPRVVDHLHQFISNKDTATYA
ncbi:methylenetetrahydrofolate reductase (NADPH) [Weissella beninensis]|uniref:Methylenetetrahydrofolate reductase n=1 Tax=Periweissella beninensis TaxID=504936 RepID=A0ABT0VKU0_9LACO|nr:methylenetetrahydrofolate reductase [Periweissella beninensis]MBM7544493.1 methylenetetrahydrofolate reductase (NADPH) [Periweissella beninensis]MCM2437032.1 methylenetetrahydrofolate reductase [Periweissella beninensis]